MRAKIRIGDEKPHRFLTQRSDEFQQGSQRQVAPSLESHHTSHGHASSSLLPLHSSSSLFVSVASSPPFFVLALYFLLPASWYFHCFLVIESFRSLLLVTYLPFCRPKCEKRDLILTFLTIESLFHLPAEILCIYKRVEDIGRRLREWDLDNLSEQIPSSRAPQNSHRIAIRSTEHV